MTRVAIVGAGISGLALAEALSRTGDDRLEVMVLERSQRAGGPIRSEVVDGYLCERGPNGFLDNAPDTLELVRRLDLGDRLLPSSDRAQRRFIYRAGHLHEIPGSPLAFFRSDLLSWPGKLRLLLEPFAARRPTRDETIHDFAARHIGAEAATVLVGSMVLGIFAGNARELSLRACFPRMWAVEDRYGSLFRALVAIRRQRRRAASAGANACPQGDSIGAPAGRLTSFVGGMEDLVRGLTTRLGPIVQLGRRVVAVRERGGPSDRFLLELSSGPPIEADMVVLTGSARESASLLASLDPLLAAELSALTTAVPLVVVSAGYDEDAVARQRGRLDGFGLLVPRGEGPRVLGVLWDSSIYPGRAPIGRALLKIMVGGAQDRSAIELDDRALIALVRADLQTVMGFDLDPLFTHITRHAAALPQYTVGHLDRLARIEAGLARHPGLCVTGSSYRGPAVNACISEASALTRCIVAGGGSVEEWMGKGARGVPEAAPGRRLQEQGSVTQL